MPLAPPQVLAVGKALAQSCHCHAWILMYFHWHVDGRHYTSSRPIQPDGSTGFANVRLTQIAHRCPCGCHWLTRQASSYSVTHHWCEHSEVCRTERNNAVRIIRQMRGHNHWLRLSRACTQGPSQTYLALQFLQFQRWVPEALPDTMTGTVVVSAQEQPRQPKGKSSKPHLNYDKPSQHCTHCTELDKYRWRWRRKDILEDFQHVATSFMSKVGAKHCEVGRINSNQDL